MIIHFYNVGSYKISLFVGISCGVVYIKSSFHVRWYREICPYTSIFRAILNDILDRQVNLAFVAYGGGGFLLMRKSE